MHLIRVHPADLARLHDEAGREVKHLPRRRAAFAVQPPARQIQSRSPLVRDLDVLVGFFGVDRPIPPHPRDLHQLVPEDGRAAGRRPEAAAGRLSFPLQRLQPGLMLDVRRIRHRPRVAQAHQLGVDQQIADPDVAQQPAVRVGRGDILLQAHSPPVHQGDVLRAGRGAVRSAHLRRVDPDVAEGELLARHEHLDRIAVDHLDDLRLAEPGVGRRGRDGCRGRLCRCRSGGGAGVAVGSTTIVVGLLTGVAVGASVTGAGVRPVLGVMTPTHPASPTSSAHSAAAAHRLYMPCSCFIMRSTLGRQRPQVSPL